MREWEHEGCLMIAMGKDFPPKLNFSTEPRKMYLCVLHVVNYRQ